MGSVRVGQEVLVLGQINAVNVQYGRRRSLCVQISDQSGSLALRFFHFNTPQQNGFKPGVWIRCYGEVRRGRHVLEIIHPEYRLYTSHPQQVTETSLTPIYPGTEGISTVSMRKFIDQAFTCELDALKEGIPDEVCKQFSIMPLRQSLKMVHRPPPNADIAALMAGTHPTQQRLAIEELLAHHLTLSRLREKHKLHNAPSCKGLGNWEKLKARLGFTLTSAQERVIREAHTDLRRSTPSTRLIQGDVGSGKTVVAAAAALATIDSGYQVALMAPTELLSEQHHKTFEGWFTPLDIQVEWLTGKMPASTRTQAIRRIQSGEAKMIIGTHALFQQGVVFQQLGLMIIDEQHRFGVAQRLALRNKAKVNPDTADHVPHQIIMSATPIPRSLAMIFYADLDVSVIDELPAGRQRVQTVVLPNNRRHEVAQRIYAGCKDKQQAYWVCPLIDESDKLQAQAATETYATLTKLLPDITIELIHGRLKSAHKGEIMRRFRLGEIDLLVTTTVIEVGVDVPSANLMIIENAERLGLAQLHQLRGRVGRSTHQSTCVLMYQPPLWKIAKERLSILRNTTDGFEIARQDLEQRGPGELLGTRQTGLQQMRIADLARDHSLLPIIEPLAQVMHKQHPDVIDTIIRRWTHSRESFAEV